MRARSMLINAPRRRLSLAIKCNFFDSDHEKAQNDFCFPTEDRAARGLTILDNRPENSQSSTKLTEIYRFGSCRAHLRTCAHAFDGSFHLECLASSRVAADCQRREHSSFERYLKCLLLGSPEKVKFFHFHLAFCGFSRSRQTSGEGRPSEISYRS